MSSAAAALDRCIWLWRADEVTAAKKPGWEELLNRRVPVSAGWVELNTFGVEINSRSGYWVLRPHVNICVCTHYQSIIIIGIELSLTGYKG